MGLDYVLDMSESTGGSLSQLPKEWEEFLCLRHTSNLLLLGNVHETNEFYLPPRAQAKARLLWPNHQEPHNQASQKLTQKQLSG